MFGQSHHPGSCLSNKELSLISKLLSCIVVLTIRDLDDMQNRLSIHSFLYISKSYVFFLIWCLTISTVSVYGVVFALHKDHGIKKLSGFLTLTILPSGHFPFETGSDGDLHRLTYFSQWALKPLQCCRWTLGHFCVWVYSLCYDFTALIGRFLFVAYSFFSPKKIILRLPGSCYMLNITKVIFINICC